MYFNSGMDNKIWTRSLNNFAKTNWVKAPDMGGWIKDIAVYNNGRILAVGRNNKLFTRANLQSKWKATPNKGGQVTGCCALKDRTVVGIGKLHNDAFLSCYNHALQGNDSSHNLVYTQV